jgi:hypothetical protein
LYSDTLYFTCSTSTGTTYFVDQQIRSIHEVLRVNINIIQYYSVVLCEFMGL